MKGGGKARQNDSDKMEGSGGLIVIEGAKKHQSTGGDIGPPISEKCL